MPEKKNKMMIPVKEKERKRLDENRAGKSRGRQYYNFPHCVPPHLQKLLKVKMIEKLSSTTLTKLCADQQQVLIPCLHTNVKRTSSNALKG